MCVPACFGCKGFFRRSIRSSQSYQCRFSKNCSIDKDQRNACRSCRFQRCLQVGMEILAIRPDRDIIGKQKNPRKRNSQNEDALLNFLIDIEHQQNNMSSKYMSDSSQFFDSQIGMVRIKSEPDVSMYELFENRSILESFSSPMRNEMMRIASVEALSEAMKGYAVSAISWINALFSLCGIENTHEKCAILKNTFSSFSAFQKATNTAAMSPDFDNLCLCNGSLIPRNAPRYLLDTNLLAQNMVGRILDELVRPIRKLQLLEAERVAVTALILLDGDNCNFTPHTSEALAGMRENVQNALFQYIREQCNNSLPTASSRFAKILLLLPSIAKISSLYNENFQLAKMFGCRSLDPLLDEILLDNNVEANSQSALSPNSRIRQMDAATQTGHQLKLDEPLGLDASAMSNSSTNSTLSSVGSGVDESSALDNIIALGLEMEQRAAQAKAEAQHMKHRHPKPHPLIVQQQQSMIPRAAHSTSAMHARAGYNNNSPPAIAPSSRGTQSAGPHMHAGHFNDFFDQQQHSTAVQHPSPPANAYTLH
ncbi:hypothetical protein M3Y97_00600800 [Aphelenchoides bicaudatus]|nr:hypothetical protein M3Y97_00600800 [Aphelenchoides bicaudatus]